VIHTPDGQVVYANDFKLDPFPVLGERTNYKRLEELGKEGNVKLLIMDSLYSDHDRKTPSESVARQMLKDVMLGVNSKDNLVVVTTFSSHIERLTSIAEFGEEMGREVVFIGRSLSKYIGAAESIGLVNFSEKYELVSYRNEIGKKLSEIQKQGRGKYLLVCTGHQGEPNAVLSRLAENQHGFEFLEGDLVIFSCSVIPSQINITNRNVLEKKLKEKNLRIFKDLHQSGHGSLEDHRDLINYLKPQHIIPSHGGLDKTTYLVPMAKELGYVEGENIHLMTNGNRLEL